MAIAFRNNDEASQPSTQNSQFKAFADNRMDISQPSMVAQGNNDHLLPDSIHNIQFTRNTQANAKTVSNVAQVLQPV